MRSNFVDSRWQKKKKKNGKTQNLLWTFPSLSCMTTQIEFFLLYFDLNRKLTIKIKFVGGHFTISFLNTKGRGCLVKSGWHHASLLKCGRLSLTATESQKGSRGICVSSWGSDTFVPYFPTHFECTPEISFGVRGRISNGRLGSLGLEVSLRCSSQYLGELYSAKNNLCIDIGNICRKDKYGI